MLLLTEHRISNPLGSNSEQLTLKHQKEEYVCHSVKGMNSNVYTDSPL